MVNIYFDILIDCTQSRQLFSTRKKIMSLNPPSCSLVHSEAIVIGAKSILRVLNNSCGA